MDKNKKKLVADTKVAKGERLHGISKLDEANNAGKKGKECTLILTEGDSAKALAVSGLSVIGRDNYGVFPLKGKLLNVRDAKITDVQKNEELKNICKIIGLDYQNEYEKSSDIQNLRYTHVMIMADQDTDGSHIKGLLINYIANFWPNLLKKDGFITEFITPIVKVKKGKEEKSFYSVSEFAQWKDKIDEKKKKKDGPSNITKDLEQAHHKKQKNILRT